MKTYIVETDGQESTRIALAQYGSVGKPNSLYDMVIIRTNHSLSELQAIDGVKSVEEDEQSIPEDIQSNTPSWYLPHISDTNNGYHYDATGKGVNLYVIDSGIRFDHTEFRDIDVHSLYSFDGEEWLETGRSPHHGTACASCAVGRQFGTAKQATLYNARTNFYASDIVKALDTILDHFKASDANGVISMSLSFERPAIAKIFDTFKDHGFVIVACAGNEGESEPRYPAKYDSVVGVGAITQYDSQAIFTNGKSGNDIWAPGQGGMAADPKSTGANRSFSGTSASCPLVAGVFAMALEGKRKLQSSEDVDIVVNHVLDKAKDIGFGKKVFNDVGDFTLPEIIPEPPKEEPVVDEPPTPTLETPKPKKKNDDDKKKKIIIGVVVAIVVGVGIYFTL